MHLFGQYNTDMYYVYVLWSERSQRFYVGYSGDLPRRLREHNAGTNRSTKYGVPWRVEYYEAYRTKALAQNRERSIKRNRGKALATLYKRIKDNA